MTKKVFSTTTESLDLEPFLTGVFYYKDDSFPAIRVTPENIGLLCMEFDAELEQFGNGNPYFTFNAYRDKEYEPKYRGLTVTLADWIFPRGDELHVWPNPIFETTFRVGSPMGEFLVDAVAREVKDYAMADAEATVEQFATNQAWHESEMRETLGSDHEQPAKPLPEGDQNFERVEALQQLADSDQPFMSVDRAREILEMPSLRGAKFDVGQGVRWTQENDVEAVGVVEEVIVPDNHIAPITYSVNVNGVLWQVQEQWLKPAIVLKKMHVSPIAGDARFEVGEEVVFHNNEFSEHVKVEGVVPQDDGTIRYSVRWPNRAQSVEAEDSLAKIDPQQ